MSNPKNDITKLEQEFRELSAVVKDLKQDIQKKDKAISELSKDKKKALPRGQVGVDHKVSYFNGKLVTRLNTGYAITDKGKERLQRYAYHKGKYILVREDIEVTYEDGKKEILNYVDFMEGRNKVNAKLKGNEGDKYYHDILKREVFIENENFYFIVEVDGKTKKIHHSAIN